MAGAAWSPTLWPYPATLERISLGNWLVPKTCCYFQARCHLFPLIYHLITWGNGKVSTERPRHSVLIPFKTEEPSVQCKNHFFVKHFLSMHYQQREWLGMEGAFSSLIPGNVLSFFFIQEADTSLNLSVPSMITLLTLVTKTVPNVDTAHFTKILSLTVFRAWLEDL